MDAVITSLIPIFAAGLAIQQFLEFLDPLLIRVIGEKDKRLILGMISMAAGLVIAFGTGLRILGPLGFSDSDPLDALVTAMVISAGTEGFNSILKFLGYAKENKKTDTAALKAWVSKDVKAKEAMARMDRTQKR